MTNLEKLTNIIESILLVSGEKVAISDIAEKLEVTDKDVLNAAKVLQEKYSGDSGIHLLIFNKKMCYRIFSVAHFHCFTIVFRTYIRHPKRS